MKSGRVKGGAAIPAVIDTGRRTRSNMAQPVFNASGLTRGIQGGAAQNIIQITSEDLVQNGGQYKLIGGAPVPMEIVTGRRSKQGAATVVYPVDMLGNYDPTFAGYIYKVLTEDAASGYDPSSLIQFLPQNELSGAVSIDHSGLGHDGAYVAVDLGQAGVPGLGMTSAGYDGLASLNNVYSASLNTAFDPTKGALIVWLKVANVGVWTDATNRWPIALVADADNFIDIIKGGASTILYRYEANNVRESVTKAGMTETGWMALGMTWDKAGDEVIMYYNGAQEGAIQNGLGVWAGNLANTGTVVGASTTGPTFVTSGNIGPYLLYNVSQPPAVMQYLSTP